MAIIPTIQRQQSLPSTTGVASPPVVQGENAIANSVSNAFAEMDKINNAVFNATATAHVSAATTNTTVKLNKLQTKLASGEPSVAFKTHETEIKKIYDDAVSGITSPIMKEEFDKKFNILSSNSKIKIRGAATTKQFSILAGGLELSLDTNLKLIGASKNNPTARHIATTNGLNDIAKAVETGVIKPDVGAKRRIKFLHDVSKNGIASWVNTTPKEGLENVYDQMDDGVFTGPNKTQNELDWKQLTEIEKETARRGVSRELKDLQRKQEKDERDNDKKVKAGQEALTGSLAGLIHEVSSGKRDKGQLPTLNKLELLKKQRKITGDQQTQLGKMLIALENPKTSPTTLLKLNTRIMNIPELPENQREAEIKLINAEMFKLSAGGKLETTHATMLVGKLDKVAQRGAKNSPLVKARLSLKRFLGASDSEFGGLGPVNTPSSI